MFHFSNSPVYEFKSKKTGQVHDPFFEVRYFFGLGFEVVDEVEAGGQKFPGRLKLDYQTLPENKMNLRHSLSFTRHTLGLVILFHFSLLISLFQEKCLPAPGFEPRMALKKINWL